MPDPIDIYVGNRLRQRRIECGFSQSQLGESIGLTFQQIQKYERGVNRIAASRLFRMSIIIGVPASYFFEGYADSANESPVNEPKLTSREALELVRYFLNIADKTTQQRIVHLIRQLGVNPG